MRTHAACSLENSHLEPGRLPEDPLMAGELLSEFVYSGKPSFVGSDHLESPLLPGRVHPAVASIHGGPEKLPAEALLQSLRIDGGIDGAQVAHGDAHALSGAALHIGLERQ